MVPLLKISITSGFRMKIRNTMARMTATTANILFVFLLIILLFELWTVSLMADLSYFA